MLLSEILPGESCIVVKVNGTGAFRKRILEMGFIRGKEVSVLLEAPMNDPIKYKIMGYEVSLRRKEASLIEVIPSSQVNSLDDSYLSPEYIIIPAENNLAKISRPDKTDVIRVALVGNPNCGKTTLFNYTSGAHEQVGNYSGVTVDSRQGSFKYKNKKFIIVDLPGTYSLSAYTPEELYVREYIVEQKPDIIINVVAASNLERNLYLTTELMELKVPVVLALNMYDELLDSGSKLDTEQLSQIFSIPAIPIVAKTGEKIDDLFEALVNYQEVSSQSINVYYGNALENSISKLNIELEQQAKTFDFPIRYLSIKLLEKDEHISSYVKSHNVTKRITEIRDEEVALLEQLYKDDIESILTNARYKFIDKVLERTYKKNEKLDEVTTKLDKVLTSKVWGFPLFFLFMFIMFAATFILGEYPKGWIEDLVDILGGVVSDFMPDGMLKDLIAQGIIGGVGEVIVFLPNIVLLYLFISFMEDSGYMARAAFIMDKAMQKIGIQGKSFIPLIMGFGCNVPSIMATRTIENRNSRMITILINPFMSCTARLPVFLLFSGIFFGKFAPLALFSLYVIGILLAIISAKVFKRFLFKTEETPFIMELPPYRMPTIKSIFRHMWDKSRQYLKKMGGIILVASIVIWFLQYFPLNENILAVYDTNIEKIEQQYQDNLISEEAMNDQILQQEHHKNMVHQENSYIGQLGKVIEPVVKPLGFDWKVGVSLVTGLAAKEVVLSTMGVLYVGDDADKKGLIEKLPMVEKEDGSKEFTTLTVISLMLFILIYFPCIATIAAIREESGTWKWALFSMVYTTGLAWIVSFCIYQIGGLLGYS